MIVRLYRMLPVLIVLAVLAVVVYLVVMYRTSPNRAKEVLIKMFSWITFVLSAFFLLATLYAWLKHNIDVADLTLSFFAASFAVLVIVRICRAVFIHHHPHYRLKGTKATTERRWPWKKK